MDRCLGAALQVGAPQRLAVDRNDIVLDAGRGTCPVNEAGLELLGIEGCKQVAELIVARRALRERSEAAQQIGLLLAELGDLDPALGAGQHRDQTEQQHLIERIPDLARLAWIVHILKVFKPFDNLIERLFCLRLRHAHVLRESREHIQIQHSPNLSRKDSPDCPATRRLKP